METIKNWLASDEVKRLKQNKQDLVERSFFRDPLRAIYLQPDIFYSPADGIVLYALDNVAPDESIVEIKGKQFTPRDALDDQAYEQNSLIIGIFMTSLDVHINRMPTSGYINECHKTPFLFTPDVSMIFEENDILEKAITPDEDLSYLFCNERKIVGVYNPKLKLKYYLIQIAEKDVDVILNWGLGKDLTQGERYGQVRFGSQVDIIIPLTGDLEYELLVKENQHIQAGIDEIIRIKEY